MFLTITVLVSASDHVVVFITASLHSAFHIAFALSKQFTQAPCQGRSLHSEPTKCVTPKAVSFNVEPRA